MRLFEIKFIPKIGKIYTTRETDPRKSDFVGTYFGVIGFRLNGRQAKIVFFDPIDIDNFDIEGPRDIKIDPNSERDPTKSEKSIMKSFNDKIKKLTKES